MTSDGCGRTFGHNTLPRPGRRIEGSAGYCLVNSIENEIEYLLGVYKPNFRLLGMDVHVNFFRRQLEEQHGQGIPSPFHKVGERAPDGAVNQLVAHRPAVHKGLDGTHGRSAVGRPCNVPMQTRVSHRVIHVHEIVPDIP